MSNLENCLFDYQEEQLPKNTAIKQSFCSFVDTVFKDSIYVDREISPLSLLDYRVHPDKE